MASTITTSYADAMMADVVDDDDDDDEDEITVPRPTVSSGMSAAAARASAFSSQDYQDALEEVHTRFILNLPPSELETADRIFFQVEQAWWFYEDWICDKQPDNKNLPRFTTLRPFALKLFEYSPLLPSPDRFAIMWNEFGKYKRKISNYGCILLNTDCTKVVLCQVWNGKSFTFPAGKINQGETGINAAARETYEETGFDPHCEFGRTSEMLQNATAGGGVKAKLPWKFPLREQDALVYQENDGKRRTSYVCRGVPEDFPFAPVVRKEVGKIDWYPLDDLPRNTYAVLPFLAQLRRWIKKRTRSGATTSTQKSRQRSTQKSRERGGHTQQQQQGRSSTAPPKTGAGRDRSSQKSRERGTPGKNRSKKNTPNRSRQNSRQRLRSEDDLVNSGLAAEGDLSGWSEEDMFSANEKILGRKVEYDGNPHDFVEKGLAVLDPHAFHVVGGGFLNAKVGSLAPPPETSKLQPLFRNEDGDVSGDNPDGGDNELQPFFSESGATPWGEVVTEVTTDDEDRRTTTPSVSPQRKTKSSKKNKQNKKAPATPQDEGTALLAMLQDDGDSCFLTDREITAQSQARNRRLLDEKSKMEGSGGASNKANATTVSLSSSSKPKASSMQERQEQLRQQYESDWAFVQQWVANLPPPPQTKHFETFSLDADAIMETAALHVKKQQQQQQQHRLS